MAQQQDFFEVELRTADGKALPVIEYDQQHWFVGEPGQEFEVAVSMINTSGSNYQVGLKVDGQGPGYDKILWGHQSKNTGVFNGWLAQSGNSSTQARTISFRRFKFGSCKPSTTASTVLSADDIPAGQIEVSLTQVVDTGVQQQSSGLRPSAPSSDAANKKLPEGKKWFLAPGLKAEAGSATSATTTWNCNILRQCCLQVGSLPSIKVRYDSSEALFLRKALNPRFAPHRAILRASANPAIASLGAEPASEPAPTSRTQQPAAAAGARRERGAAVKREGLGVKRERSSDSEDDDDEPTVPRSATAAERVDLTEEPVRPMMVGGRQVAPDEFAVCDLCDSEDEGPASKWEVKKKKHIKLEL